MRVRTWRVVLAAAIAAVLGVGAGCGQASAESEADVTLTVGTPNKVGAHRWLLASGQGADTSYGVEYADFDSTAPLIEAMNAGEVDIAAGGETGVLFALGNGSEFTAVAANEQRGKGGHKVLVRGDSPYHSVTDLRGRRIALPFYSKQHYQLAMALHQLGLTWDDAEIVNLSTADGLSALRTGSVDAFVVWDPQAAIAEVEHGARAVFNLVDAADDPSMVYVRTVLLQDPVTRAAVGDLVSRLGRGLEWTNDNAEEWARQVSELSAVSPTVAQLQVSRAEQHLAPITDDVVDAWQRQADYFAGIGELTAPVTVEDHVDRGFGDVIEAAGQR